MSVLVALLLLSPVVAVRHEDAELDLNAEAGKAWVDSQGLDGKLDIHGNGKIEVEGNLSSIQLVTAHDGVSTGDGNWWNDVAGWASQLIAKISGAVESGTNAVINKLQPVVNNNLKDEKNADQCVRNIYWKGLLRGIHTCSEGEEKIALACYQPCDDGSPTVKGSTTCENSGRPRPVRPLTCAEGEEYYLGICYPKCDEDYEGWGPLCLWKCTEPGQTSAKSIFCCKGDSCNDLDELVEEIPEKLRLILTHKSNGKHAVNKLRFLTSLKNYFMKFKIPFCNGETLESKGHETVWKWL